MIIEIEGRTDKERMKLVNALKIAGVVKSLVNNPLGVPEMDYLEKVLIPLAADGWVHAVNGGHGEEWRRANEVESIGFDGFSSLQFWTVDTILSNHETLVVFLMDDDAQDASEIWENFLLDTRCKVLRVDPRFNVDEVVKSLNRYVMLGAL